jgi:hypothetical protein
MSVGTLRMANRGSDVNKILFRMNSVRSVQLESVHCRSLAAIRYVAHAVPFVSLLVSFEQRVLLAVSI